MPSIGKIAENPLNIAFPRTMVKIEQIFSGGFSGCHGLIEHVKERSLGILPGFRRVMANTRETREQ